MEEKKSENFEKELGKFSEILNEKYGVDLLGMLKKGGEYVEQPSIHTQQNRKIIKGIRETGNYTKIILILTIFLLLITILNVLGVM